MEFEQRIEGGVVIAKLLEKRLDARSAASFKDSMAELIRSGQDRIALDISEIEFVDSSGLGAIVSTLKQLGGSGDLVICGARDTVMSVFKLTRLDRVFQMFPSRQEAVAVLRT